MKRGIIVLLFIGLLLLLSFLFWHLKPPQFPEELFIQEEQADQQ